MRILTAGINEIFDQEPIPSSNDRYYLNKPPSKGVLWGSSLLKDRNGYIYSDWIRWCALEDFCIDKYSYAVSYTIKKNSKVFTVDSIDDYCKLLYQFPLPDDRLSLSTLFIDWITFSKYYDAFHLTENGFWKLRFLYGFEIEINGKVYRTSDFYSYDCESWIIFNYDIINKGSIQNVSLKSYLRNML